MKAPPALHVIAGSNGSGKSTLYERELRHRLVGLPFVNADNLARDAFGHAAETVAEAQEGQRLANEARERLLAAGDSFITETTFSHPSKLELIASARARGYAITVYQVGVRSPELAVERVRLRVQLGGHPVPEEKTRARWARSQPLIRDAVRDADVGYVYDNSRDDFPHRIALILRRGQLLHVADGEVPEWVRKLYPDELQGYAPAVLNPGANSFAMARTVAQAMLGEAARVFIANPSGSYLGDVLATTTLHTLQHVAPERAVAHFTSNLDPAPAADAHVRITYRGDPARGTVVDVARPAVANGREPNPAAAAALRDLAPDAAVKAHPQLRDAYALVRAFSAYLDQSGCLTTAALAGAFQARLARAIEVGEPLPAVGIARAATPTQGAGQGQEP